MKKAFLTIAAAAAAFGFSAVANAAILDFANDATVNGERALALTAAGVPNLTIAGINMRITATSGDADGVTYGYMDGPGGEGPAGLGVCQDIDGANQCVPGNDDNVTTGEAVTITFLDGPFNIQQLSFRGEGHVDKNGDAVNTLLIALNGGAAVAYTFAGAVAAAIGGAFLGATSISFAFGGASADQFYLSAISDVPIPGALPLLLSGLAGLGFASRRKKAA